MVPDFDLQLQVVIDALTKTVMPAVDPANKVAQEQLQLSLATLSMVRQRLPLARRFARRLVKDGLEMAAAVRAAAAGCPANALALLDKAIEDGRARLQDCAADLADLEQSRSVLTDGTVSVIAAATDEAAQAKLEAIVLKYSQPAIEAGRAWFIGSGFEPDSKAIRPIEELI